MKKLYVSAIIAFLALSLPAQNLWLGEEGQRFYDELLIRKAVKGEAGNYEGSPYLDEEFTDAKIRSSEDHVFEKVSLRYNAYYDLFEVKMEDDVYNLRRGGMVSEVNMTGHLFKYFEYDYLSTKAEGYLELLHEGKYSLYKKHQVIFTEAEPSKPYQEAKPAMFQERDPLFFIASGEKPPVFIKNRKGLLSLAGDKEEELNDYLRNNRNRLRNEADFLNAVKFLNEL